MIRIKLDQWMHRLTEFGMKFMRLLPPELSHELGLALMQRPSFFKLTPPPYLINRNRMSTSIPGIGKLHHPIGLAAGFDKHAQAPLAFAHLGLSFLELGTITPRPQVGNPKPRLFRYSDQRAIINRMGFNSHGAERVAERLAALASKQHPVPFGINLGKNKDTKMEAAIDDYNFGLNKFRHHADYFVINISSPNTENLRSLANADFLKDLASANHDILGKVWIKLDPDTSRRDFQNLIESIASLGFQGVILTNTHKVAWPEAGGQSGHPISIMANARLEWAWQVHRGALPMIASGGILSGTDVIERISRGAHAVQIYSALVYRGPWAAHKILKEMDEEMQARGIEFLEDIRGQYYHSDEAGA